MGLTCRLLLCFCVPLVVLSAAFLATRPLLDVASNMWEEAERRERLSEALDRDCAAAHECNRAKQEVAVAVAEGRLTLWQAAGRFHALHGRPAGYSDLFREKNPGRSDGECLCRNVIAWAQAQAERSRREEVSARLERELQDRLAAGVPLPLPE